MSTPTNGVSVTLLDGEHLLRYPNSSLRRLERALGGWENFGALPLDSTFTCLWAGLLHEGVERSVDEVADLVEMADFVSISQAVTEAVTSAMPSGDKKPGKAKRGPEKE